MSSTSSICSSNDIDCAERRIPPAIRRDVERFSIFISRLRAALDVNTNVPDGESMCVSVHAALEMVSESMRDLFKHSQFKTNHIILSSLQLVQSVKDLKFDSAMVDTSRVENIIDQLESAVLNTIISSHVTQPSPIRYATLGRRPKQEFAQLDYNTYSVMSSAFSLTTPMPPDCLRSQLLKNGADVISEYKDSDPC
ncbi:hypothetical protein KIN20_032618 [Parelaphostrongylus tenuis]|uniref:Rho GTPase-activating protein 29/45 N-terminal domain-containing protein n=1 Tax=Parelaphostrongylus tenuis TaxID=148309 RepID=A0AAD5R7E1_PARTN|nr:hypothetical protein KIN20_032618 [Parelaphostrongylus tenuis]